MSVNIYLPLGLKDIFTSCSVVGVVRFFPLLLIFSGFIVTCLGAVCFVFILLEICWVYPAWNLLSLLNLWVYIFLISRISQQYFFKYFFFLSSSSLFLGITHCYILLKVASPLYIFSVFFSLSFSLDSFYCSVSGSLVLYSAVWFS